MTPSDIKDLRYAKSLLESPGLAPKISRIFETPLQKGMLLLPSRWSTAVNRATQKALGKALNLVLSSYGPSFGKRSADRAHKMLATSAGAVSGAFGLPVLLIELPITTTIMMRSILDIANSEGADLEDPQIHLECIQVLAFGNTAQNPSAPDTGYFAARAALHQGLKGAALHIAQMGALNPSAPAIVRFLSQVSARFGAVVSEKLAAQTVPLIGAAGGALINAMFIKHFQKVAHGHFIIRRLEGHYDQDKVREQYDRED